VVVVDPGIVDCYDDIAASRGDVPGGERANIRAGGGRATRLTSVVQSPKPGEQRSFGVAAALTMKFGSTYSTLGSCASRAAATSASTPDAATT
jgi:hypothetical protein